MAIQLGTGTYTQNFDSLAATGTSSVVPDGWAFGETGSSANGLYTAGTGASNTGDTYSFGTDADRAFGRLQSTANTGSIGASFANATGAAITALDIAYTGEEWRLGTAGRQDRLDFQISFDATSLTTGTWTNVDQLDFATPDTAGTGAKNGNLTAEQSAISYTLANLGIAAGQTFWIRWLDFDATGADDGLAVDNFSLTAHTAAVAPATFSVAAASGGEATGVDFTVTRAGDATAAATLTWAVSAGTADASDFQGNVLPTGTVHFDAGATTATFHVATFDDTVYEGDETFTATLTGTDAGSIPAAGASATGTIVDNDPAPQHGALSVADAAALEGDAGTTLIHFTVTRDGGSDGAISASWAVTPGTADAGDFVGGTLPAGTVSFAAGQTTATIDVPVQGDTTYEADETFTLTLSNAQGGATLADPTATGTILNDDTATPGRVRLFAEDFTGFTAKGFAPNPTAGQLDSDVWRVDGLSDNPTAAYGATLTTGDFARGVIAGAADPTTGGVYSPSANAALVVQPTGTDFDPNGFIEARIVNTSGQTATSFDVAFDWAYRNSGDRADPLQLSYSTDGTTFIAMPAAAFTTPAAKDAAVAAVFSDQHEAVTLSGLAVPTGDALYLRWQHGTSTGAANRDEIGIDNVTVDATVTNQPLLSVSPITVNEGNSGTTDAVFTFTRSSGVGAASVDYQTVDGTATAGSDYVATSGTVRFADGQTTATVAVPVIGDTRFESDETFTLHLSNATGVLVPRTDVTATIVNDDQNQVAIYDIQGAGPVSPLVGQVVATTGIVTAVTNTGFYLQDPTGDGNTATSDGIFVFTRTAPAVAQGDAVTATGTIAEYAADPSVGLTLTELNTASATDVAVLSHGNALPAATVIGIDGRLPPTQLIDGPDGLSNYDPTTHGVDFYESLEGMLVTVENPQVIQSTNSFGETYVVASNGVGATNVAARGGLTLGPGDFNPERIQIDDALLPGGQQGTLTEGDHLASVTGVVGYSFDEYEVLALAQPAVTQAGNLAREVTALHGDADHLSVGTYNLENLDASDGKYDILARDIVVNMGAPDIVSVQEVQDDSGATDNGVTTAAQNLTNLVNALNAADPAAHYVYAEIDPANDSTGGEPGGNIRNAFLYNTNRVMLEAGSLTQITGAAFTNSRNPLVGTFSFNGKDLTVVDVHSYSRGGSDPDFGANQPAQARGDDRRTAIADATRGYIDNQLATDPNHQFAVMGDFNGFYYEKAFTDLTAGNVLTNLSVALLPPEERYSYQFDASLQEFDYILTTAGVTAGAQYDSVHINAEYANTNRPTDHDPQVAVLSIPRPEVAPDTLTLTGSSVAENLPANTVVGTLHANDANGDTLFYALTDTASGHFKVDAASGVVTTTQALDYEAAHGYTIAATATDPSGLSTAATFQIAVTDVNEAPVAADDAATVKVRTFSPNLYATLLANDADPEGEALTITGVDTTGTRGSVRFDAASHSLVYAALSPAFNLLKPGQSYVDHFTYTVADPEGLSTTAGVDVTVTNGARTVRPSQSAPLNLADLPDLDTGLDNLLVQNGFAATSVKLADVSHESIKVPALALVDAGHAMSIVGGIHLVHVDSAHPMPMNEMLV